MERDLFYQYLLTSIKLSETPLAKMNLWNLIIKGTIHSRLLSMNTLPEHKLHKKPNYNQKIYWGTGDQGKMS